MMNRQSTRILLLSCFFFGALLSPVSAFVQPFGVRSKPIASVSSEACPAFQQQQHTHFCPTTSLWAGKRKKAGEDDDDWEPNEAELLSEAEDLTTLDDVGDVDSLIVEDELVVAADEDDGVAKSKKKKSSDDDEDEDEIELDVDIWDADEEVFADDAIVEENETGEEEWEDEEEGAEAYLGGEGDEDNEEWEEDELVPLEDDLDDPNYMTQKKLVEEVVARREQQAEDDSFDEVDFMMNHMNKDQMEAMDALPLNQKVEEMAKEMIVISDDDVKNMDIEKEMANTPDLMIDDPYENEGETDIFGTGIADNDLEALDTAWKGVQKKIDEGPWDKVSGKVEETIWDDLPSRTIEEMEACLDEIGGSAYNSTRWLLYDLDFNVSNLILAAVQHNKKAPILFQHWYPQLLTYDRYQHARDRDFDFTWADVENADLSELERYYLGFGYEEIPTKAPAETGIISFEDMDEEELKMAAFENWMIDVYNPEWDRKDFDDDEFRDEDNVFSDFFVAPQHPDLPTFEDAQEDLREWEEDIGDAKEDSEYRDFMGKDFKYKMEEDKEFQKEFRGHLVLACSPADEDLEIAEQLTARFAEAFGKKIYVETRVMAHVREEDNVFEIWIESYEIQLLHSKKRAMAGAEEWDGPVECDTAQIDYLVDRVQFMISDEARFSYTMDYDLKA